MAKKGGPKHGYLDNTSKEIVAFQLKKLKGK